MYIQQGGHHVRHWPTFLVCSYFCCAEIPSELVNCQSGAVGALKQSSCTLLLFRRRTRTEAQLMRHAMQEGLRIREIRKSSKDT